MALFWCFVPGRWVQPGRWTEAEREGRTHDGSIFIFQTHSNQFTLQGGSGRTATGTPIGSGSSRPANEWFDWIMVNVGADLRTASQWWLAVRCGAELFGMSGWNKSGLDAVGKELVIQKGLKSRRNPAILQFFYWGECCVAGCFSCFSP